LVTITINLLFFINISTEPMIRDLHVVGVLIELLVFDPTSDYSDQVCSQFFRRHAKVVVQN